MFSRFLDHLEVQREDEDALPAERFKPSAVPKEFAWPSLLARDGDELETHLASQARHQLVAPNHDVRFAHCGPACEFQLST